MMITIPSIGLALDRDLLPQINKPKDFIDMLDKKEISHKEEMVDPDTLKAIQTEFDKDKIANIMLDPYNLMGIIISNDNYILDGHHRWVAAYNKGIKIKATRVDLPILELINIAKRNNVTECVKNVIKNAVRLRYYK